MLRAQTHEFSNTLHTIAGLIQTEAYQEALDLIIKKTHAHEEIIRMLTDIIDDSIISAIILGKYNYAQELQIDFRIDGASNMKDIPPNISREKLITILGNLIDNAFESVLKNEDTTKIVTLSMTDYGHDLIFEVEDSGVGIDTKLIENIFKPGVSTKKKKGHGFGLYLVAKNVKSLHGVIEVEESELGGAAFTVIIPKFKRSDSMDDISVLIVEDDIKILEIHKMFVEKISCFNVVGLADNIEDAKQMIKILKPNLILLDLFFPKGHGLDLVYDLKSLRNESDIILITAAQEIETLKKALRAGVFDYIIKPIIFQRFKESLNRYKDFDINFQAIK